MSRTLIEQEGIDIVRKYIRKNGFMVPYMDENDKTPMWDGYIYVYKKNINNINENNALFDFRVPVQVKTTKLIDDDVFPNSAHFDIPINNLRNYQTDGGLVFFYVLYKDGDNNHEIYCDYLTKEKLKVILGKTTSTITKSVTLEKITNNPAEFRRNLRMVHLQSGHTVIDINKLDQQRVRSFTLIVDKDNEKEDRVSSLTRHSVNVLVNIEGLNDSLYLFGNPAKLQIVTTKEVPVSINGRVFYHSISTQYKDDGLYLLFGKSTYIRIPNDTQFKARVDLTYQTQSTSLDEVINDLDFIISFVQTQSLFIDNRLLELEGLKSESRNIDSFKKELIFWKNVKKVFGLLHVRGDLNPSNLQKKDYDNLNLLVNSFIFNKPVYNPNIQEQIYDLEICGLHIYIFAKRVKDNYFTLCDIYSILHSCYKDENNIFHDSTPLSIIFNLAKLPSNLYLDNIIQEYEKYIKFNDSIYERATLDLLNMLLHYDIIQDNYLIEAAFNLSCWLVKQKSITKEERLVFKLNYFQTKIRLSGSLSSNEIEELIKMRIHDDGYNFARYLLVGNKEKATFYFRKLNENQKNILKSQPIYHFMNI